MSDELFGDLHKWRYLAGEARAGRLVLDPEVARVCVAACDTLLSRLDAVRRDVRALDVVVDLGDFECGAQLARGLHEAAVGRDGLGGRIGEHMDVVRLIRDTVRGQAARTVAADERAGSGIRVAGQGH